MNDETSAPPPSDAQSSAETPPESKRPVWLQVVLGIVMAVVGLAVVGLLIGFLLPSAFVVSRSTVIDAPPAVIHPFVNTLNTWPQWTTWNTDNYPELKYSYEGSESGVGAIQLWTDPGMGDGRLEITQSSEETGITFVLHFDEFENPLQGTIAYEPHADDGTHVTWTGRGDVGSNPIGRYFGLMMDSRIGADYEAALAKLKRLVESPPAAAVPSPAE